MVRVYMEGDALLPGGLLVKLGELYCKFFGHVFYYSGYAIYFLTGGVSERRGVGLYRLLYKFVERWGRF
jgi:hypothetical protein